MTVFITGIIIGGLSLAGIAYSIIKYVLDKK